MKREKFTGVLVAVITFNLFHKLLIHYGPLSLQEVDCRLNIILQTHHDDFPMVYVMLPRVTRIVYMVKWQDELNVTWKEGRTEGRKEGSPQRVQNLNKISPKLKSRTLLLPSWTVITIMTLMTIRSCQRLEVSLRVQWYDTSLVIDNAAVCVGRCGFDFRTKPLVLLTEILAVFLIYSRQMLGLFLKREHDGSHILVIDHAVSKINWYFMIITVAKRR